MAQKIGNLYTGNSVDNSQNKLNQYHYRYFKDLETFNFKYGLELIDSNPYGGDEDPIILGFDIRINTITSPLFNDMNSFFDYIGPRIKEIDSRRAVYNDFIDHFSLFFDKTDSNLLKNFKSHYLRSINGLDKLVNTGDKQFTKFGEDMLKIKMSEDVTMNGGYLSMLYKTLSYSKINGKQIIPENLLRFDMDIIISEIRNYNKVLKSITQTNLDDNANTTEDSKNIVNIVSDNMSRYVYHLYDCQFVFDELSHDAEVSNISKEIQNDFEFGIMYKFSTVEMEKWKLDQFKYLNNANKNPSIFMDSSPSSDNTPKTAEPYMVIDEQAQNEEQLKKDSESDLSSIKNSTNKNGDDLIKKPGDLNGDGEITGKEKVKSALDKLKEDTAKRAAQTIQQRRNELINKVVEQIRGSLGLRRINSPVNVYYDNNSLLGVIRNEIYDFANQGFSGSLENINSLINKKNAKK
jgi:hypothetical protein